MYNNRADKIYRNEIGEIMEEERIILPQVDKELARRRNQQIVDLVNKGIRPAEVARMFKITRQRVHQILLAEREQK